MSRVKSLMKAPRLLTAAILALAAGAVGAAAAQERLIDREPFDRLILDGANRNQQLDVLPEAFPNRRVPERAERTGTLRVRLVEYPLQQFDVRWSSVVQVRLFEQLVLDEAQELARQGRFAEAYEYLAHLHRHHADWPGLNQTTENTLEMEVARTFQQGQFEKAWMVLTALYDRNPQHAGIGRAFGNVADRLLEAHVGEGDFNKARRFLAVLESRYGDVSQGIVNSWTTRLRGMADDKLAAARADLAAGRLDDARRNVDAAMGIEPDLAAAAALAREIEAARPRVVVGVVAEAPRRLTRRLDDWASRRLEGLVDPPLVELRGFGAEGGEYRSPYGELLHEGGSLATSLVLPSSPEAGHAPAAHVVARRLLALSQARATGVAENLIAQLREIAVEPSHSVRLTWQRAHVRPEALLRIGLSDHMDLVADGYGPFQLKSRSQREVRFIRKTASPSPMAPVEIVERFYASEDDAVDALLRGEVDMVERIAATHVSRLRRRNDIVVDSYALPTVHVLVAAPASPLMQLPELRRAVLYGLNRPGIAQQLLVSDGPAGSAGVISGPFAPGADFNDAIGYAYNRAIEPRAFDPRLAATLATVAARLHDRAGERPAGDVNAADLPELVLAHPREPIPRAACQMIRQQLGALGITVRLEEYAPDDLVEGAGAAFDLRYAELAMWEPVVDAVRLLGPRGELGSCTARMGLALAEVGGAQTWQGVRQGLMEVHRVAAEELAVIPLWQTTNYFAYRRRVQQVPARPVTLYQNAAEWELHPRGEAVR